MMPIDPAVIPIPIIIPNSSNPWRPDGTLIKVVDSIIIEMQTGLHQDRCIHLTY